jgi:hypothetical protein
VIAAAVLHDALCEACVAREALARLQGDTVQQQMRCDKEAKNDNFVISEATRVEVSKSDSFVVSNASMNSG